MSIDQLHIEEYNEVRISLDYRIKSKTNI